MLKTILQKLLKPNHQPEMFIAKPGQDSPFSRPRGMEFADELISRYWLDNTGTNNHHTAKMIKKIGEKMAGECRRILNSPDPVAANRQQLAESVSSCAKLQVLMIPPAPEADATGLRGHFGITGELKARILDIIKVDAEFESFPDKLDAAQAWNQIQYAYRRAWAYMNIFEGLRHEVGDVHPEQAQDWFRPFFACQCAYTEHVYRSELGMQDVAGLAGSKYGDFRDIVLHGDQYPDLVWGENYPELENPKVVWSS